MLRLAIGLCLALVSACANAEVRIKDISTIQGLRDNQIVGYGLVVGLQGTGDTLRNAPFTEQSLQSMLDRMGVNVRNTRLRTRNVAAVVVTADLPALIGRGARIDVTVSALGDSTSLQGGTLVLTPLIGGDGVTHAVAQGAVEVSGSTASGQAETLTQGVPTAGRIPNGALIELAPPSRFGAFGTLVLELKNPDFNTAITVADTINRFSYGRFGFKAARERDFRTIALIVPPRVGPTRFVAEIGDLMVEPDTPARVVVDEKTGTVVIGQDVQISTVAVTQGNLTVRITELPTVSQPQPFSQGKTVVTPRSVVESSEAGGHLAIVGGADLRTLVRGLNQIGLKPSGIIAILQAIKSAGALQADLVTQ
jgi:flagellar P-ring protein precursor FlgI